MTIQFLGATRTVTGSCYLIKQGPIKILVDCGMFQGGRDLEERNYAPFEFDPKEIDFLVLTHAHLDHCGLIPRLVKEGFAGKIYSTQVTKELFEINAYDAAKIQKEEGEINNVRILYTASDVLRALSLFETVPYNQTVKLFTEMYFELKDAGHILGASFIVFTIEGKKIVFSGDLGHRGQRIVANIDNLPNADVLIMESTYADREHRTREDTLNEFTQVINETAHKKGNIIIPSFAVERTQEIVFELNILMQQRKIPLIPVYIDSPLAEKATKIFMEHYPDFNQYAQSFMKNGSDPLQFPNLHFVETYAKSKKLSKRNTLKAFQGGKNFIVIAGSGMCNGGRVLRYLSTNLGLSRSTILIVGYQATGTLGRSLVDGDKKVSIFGKRITVRARVVTINGFSAHADIQDLESWIRNTTRKPSHVFIVHGEEDVSSRFAETLKELFNINAVVPQWKDIITID